MKILYLGNSDTNTDKYVTQLAYSTGNTNNGLCEGLDFVPATDGYYHCSLGDINGSNCHSDLFKRFDQIRMTDQEIKDWSSIQLLVTTFIFCRDLDRNGLNVDYKQNKNVQNLIYFSDLQKTNKSFCIYPWIGNVRKNDSRFVCKYSSAPIEDITDVQNKMLNGQIVLKPCKPCYTLEMRNILSGPRLVDTIHWVGKLGLKNLEDLNTISNTNTYEVNLDNINIVDVELFEQHTQVNIIEDRTDIDIISDFLEKCIKYNKTNFELNITTDGMDIDERFSNLVKKFNNFTLWVNLDGYEKINDYVRWGTSWDTIISNIKRISNNGHNLGINIMPSLYNITNLHLLCEFLDKNFPYTRVNIESNYASWQSQFNFPDANYAKQTIERCLATRSIWRDPVTKANGMMECLRYYSYGKTVFDPVALREFFVYNNELDKKKGCHLKDYIPELELCRSLVEGL